MNRMQNALAVHDIRFEVNPTHSVLPSESIVKSLITIIKNGAPGGCPTSSLYDVAVNSIQSHQLAVDSQVRI
jgi:hypothetical protein